MKRKFQVRFWIDHRLSRGSKYSLRDICICIVDRYALTDAEVNQIADLAVGSAFNNGDLSIKRVAK